LRKLKAKETQMARPLIQQVALGGATLAVAIAARRWLAGRSFRFRDQTVLITGGTRGLGLELARQALAAGARVAICGRDDETLRRALQILRPIGTAVGEVCDIRDREDVERLIERVTNHFGPIDVLINNAGVISVGPIATMTLEDFELALDTHFWGHVHTTLAVLPEMSRRRAGRIVNISSIGGVIGVPHLTPYCASKFALTGFSEALGAEVKKDGVYVTTVIPGLMRTGSPPQALFKGQHQAEYAWFTISDSIPGASINARRAARQILAACRRGDPNFVVSLPAKFAVAVHGLLPGVSSYVLDTMNRILPDAGVSDTAAEKGYQSTSAWAPSPLTALTQNAARRNNELPQ
jgi:NAD(P)-dependent dehydrogenase (short-subunit alcohol dehydrogenase family)